MSSGAYNGYHVDEQWWGSIAELRAVLEAGYLGEHQDCPLAEGGVYMNCPVVPGSEHFVHALEHRPEHVEFECSGGCDEEAIRARVLDAQALAASDALDIGATANGSGGARPRHSNGPVWPDPPAAAAFHGLAGEIVRTIEPHSEADPAALLVSLLDAFGNACGRGPGFQVEGDFHATNLYAVVVGDTSKGRKGTSWGQVRRIFEVADPEWTRERTAGGLASGEGLIYHVRDPQSKQVPVKEKGKPTGEYVEEIVDAGVEDKRLLVFESEFAQVLKVMAREGNTLSPVVRDLWDRGDARTLSKNSPVRATGALVSIIAHVTADELRRGLTATEVANGFANRFLFVCAKRSKQLPEGGSLSDDELRPLADQLRDAIRSAGLRGLIDRDDAARKQWAEVYGELSEGRPGLLGAATSRAEAQVGRLAVIYALLDQASQVRVEHLRAALALWDYCHRSAAHVFGTALGDPLADELLERLRSAASGGLSRTEIRDALGRHRSGDEIDRALGLLEERALAKREEHATGGRPVERWYAT